MTGFRALTMALHHVDDNGAISILTGGRRTMSSVCGLLELELGFERGDWEVRSRWTLWEERWR